MKAGGSCRPGNFSSAPTRPRASSTCAIETLPERGAPKTVSQTDALEWSAVLRSCSAWDAYKTIYGADVHPRLVAEFLLLNDNFPRSLRFCVSELNRAVRRISGVAEGYFCNDAEKLTGRFLAELQFSTIDEIFDCGLHQYLDDAQIEIEQYRRRAVQRLYFPAVPKSRRRAHGAAGGTAAAGVEFAIPIRHSKFYMSIHVALHHKTHYKYDRLVNLGPQVVRLRPAPHSRTRILSYSLKITPEKHFINWMQDPQSNYAARLVFEQPTREFCVEVDLVAEMAVLNPFDFFLEPQAEKFPFAYDPALDHELAPFQRKCWLTPAFTKYLTAIRRDLLGEVKRRTKKERLEIPEKEKPRTNDFLVAINQRLWKDIKYPVRLEPGVQTPEETLEKVQRLVPRFGVAAVPVVAPLRTRRAFCQRLFDPTQSRREIARRPERRGKRFHRLARVERSLSARRRLDRA